MITKPIRLALLVAASLAAVAATVMILGWLLFDEYQAREQLEAELGAALGMDVTIAQPPSFNLFPRTSVTLADLEVSRQGQVVASAEKARVRIGFFSLLAGNVRPLELHLQRPVFSIERLSPGVFNVYSSETGSGALDDLSLRRVQLSEAQLSFKDRSSGQEWLFEHCDLDLRNVHHAGGTRDQRSRSVATEGEFQCSSLSQARFAISQLSAEFRAGNGVLELDVVGGRAFDGDLLAQLQVDVSSEPPRSRLTSTLSQFEIGAFMAVLATTQATTGKMDLELVLDAHGSSWRDVRGSAAGTLNLAAGELELVGYNLDEELDNYAATQRFNLIDVGAVFLAGPFGLVASRGYAFSGLLEGSSGRTRIVQMVSTWTVQDGVAQAKDVAFRTPENRLALVGGLDFNQYRFRDLQVAVVDPEGCAVVEQMISGPFHAPEVKRPNFLVAAVGPLLKLIKRGMRAISNRECTKFYAGSISHP